MYFDPNAMEFCKEMSRLTICQYCFLQKKNITKITDDSQISKQIRQHCFYIKKAGNKPLLESQMTQFQQRHIKRGRAQWVL